MEGSSTIVLGDFISSMVRKAAELKASDNIMVSAQERLESV